MGVLFVYFEKKLVLGLYLILESGTQGLWRQQKSQGVFGGLRALK